MYKKLFFSIILLFLLNIAVQAQTRTVTGIVTDGTGETVPGVTVVIKGTTKGTSTDGNGKYSITVPSTGATLLFSFIGMETVEQAVTSNVMDVVMKEGGIMIEEVVAIGYGTTRKRDLTGAVSSIKGASISQIPVATAAEALTGRVAGVQITTSEGSPGAEIKVRVRGGGSITQDNEPLYIIDGFPSDDGLVSLDPTNIESIDVLKDASSTAIYGARGANGVIIIATKGGKEGQTRVNYDGYFGVKSIANKLEVMSPYEFVLWQYDVRTIKDLKATSSTYKDYYGEWDDLYYNYPGGGVDWQEELFGRIAPTQNHSLSINGGSKVTKYNVSYSYNNEDGILINTGYVRHIANMKLDHKAFNDKLTLSFNANYTDRNVLGGGAYGSTKRLIDALQYRPTMGLQYTDEELLQMDQDETNTGVKVNNLFNPLKTQLNEYRNKHNTTTVMNASVNVEIIKGLDLKVMGGLSSDFYREDQANLSGSKSAVLNESGGIWAKVINRDTRKWTNTNTLSYKLNLSNTKHSANFMVGNEQIMTTSRSVTAQNNYFPDVGIVLENLNLGTSPSRPSSSESGTSLVSFFGRAFYAYDDRYLLTATFRADGSSKFAANNRWGYFPSVSAAWRIDQEAFVKNSAFTRFVQLQTLKLRATAGLSGNNRIDNDQFLTTYNFGSYSVNNELQTTVYSNSYANPNLKWETTVARNIGVDWAILKGRIGGAVDWYLNDTRDLLIEQKVPSLTGYTTQFQNVGDTRNTGFELSFNLVPFAAKSRKEPQWNIDFNISFNKNTVRSLGQLNEFFYSTGNVSSNDNDYLVRVGLPVGSMYGYVTDGYYTVDDFVFDPTVLPSVSRQNDYEAYTLRESAPTTEMYKVAPGVLKLKDISGPSGAPDGVIDAYDQTVIGDATPTHFGGLNNTLMWRGFDLSVFINWVYGQDVYNMNKLKVTTATSYDANTLAIMNDRWRVTDASGNDMRYNPSALKQINTGVKYWRPQQTNLYHSWGVEDGSFLRINNVTLGYTLPESALQKMRIQKMRFYVTINNLYILTNYTGYDPEVNSNSSPLAPNVDYSAYPRSRTYTLGLNFTF